ncbi:MAG: hypothetical protein K0R61_4692 [Microvirga sp.]|jgi:hypothetical protein|nr:hypothetical protein [Geminicoccaceae bacterium]MDF2974242.1 hypothetical protein [Microvirga sp.]
MLRELSTVDPAYLTGLAIFSGSVVGALTSLTSAWLTKQHEARHQRASEAKLWRQRLKPQVRFVPAAVLRFGQQPTEDGCRHARHASVT